MDHPTESQGVVESTTNLPPPSNETSASCESKNSVFGGANLGKKLFRLKNLYELQDTEENNDDSQLKKVLGTKDLVSLGVGSSVGTGIYLVSGMVAKKMAGPAVVLSFAIAGFASLLSGFCYAELGNRVPHTTGSAYVYTYVTVGEFVAFVVGWNIILEYIIGTAACACALSATLDILSSGAISNITDAWSGQNQILESPDIVAFIITLLMMLIFFFGVRRSVTFNHVLNAFNVISWGLIVLIGSMFIKSENWSNFMPFGMRGVFQGAARSFYAFIGFDIIATTGEEAKRPKESIPKAIIFSLLIITAAYISCSAIMTLMVNYQDLNQDAGMIQIWGQVNYPSMEWIMSIGALGALTVSMFGSMFPMPRIAYAMSKDGLLFEMMGRVNTRGVPACATLWLGLASALCALFFPLDVLIEMISIGTLLAYTLVNSAVLILRYLPDRKSLYELFSEDKPKEIEQKEDENYAEIPPKREDDLEEVAKLQEYSNNTGFLKQTKDLINGKHPVQANRGCTKEGGRIVIYLFLSLLVLIIIFDLAWVLSEDYVDESINLTPLFLIPLLGVICLTVAISHFPQSKSRGYCAPGVPVVPVIGIIINIYLMMRLSQYTLIRFSVWMIIGLILYFKYGIWDSSAEDWK